MALRSADTTRLLRALSLPLLVCERLRSVHYYYVYCKTCLLCWCSKMRHVFCAPCELIRWQAVEAVQGERLREVTDGRVWWR
jgi:hypothetical protein